MYLDRFPNEVFWSHQENKLRHAVQNDAFVL